MKLICARIRRHVLFAMANPRATDTEAREPGFSQHTCYVHGVISNRILPRKEAVYRVQCSLPRSSDINML